MLRSIKVPDVRNVAAGGTATINLPVGWSYESITLNYSGSGALTRAQIENIELLANGKPIMYFGNGDELDAINDFYGRADTAGFLTLHFRRREFDSLAMDRVCRLGTSDVSTLQLRFNINAAATTPAVAAHARVEDRAEPMGLICKVKRFTYNSGSGTTLEVPDLPKGPRIIAIHWKKSDVSNVEIEVNGVRVKDEAKTLAEVYQKEDGRAPVTAGYTHTDFVSDGDIFGALVTDPAIVKDLRARLTLGAGGAVVALVEYLDGFEGL